MKRLLITTALVLSTLLTQAQSHIRAYNVSFGYKEDSGTRWVVENKPVNILITVEPNIFKVYSEKTQIFHFIEEVANDKKYNMYKCSDDDNATCLITVISSETNKNMGVFIVDYSNVVYYYGVYLED